jgi:hypothetical protein
VPHYLKDILESEAWRKFTAPAGPQHYDHFEEFVTTPPTKGLGTSTDLIRRLVGGDPKAVDLLDRALQRPDGGDHRSDEYKATVDNVNGVRPTGNSEAAALRRLRKDRPDLHARVIKGEMKAHAAMVEAGFRHQTITVPIDDMKALAAVLRRRLTPEQWTEFLHWAPDRDD